MTHYSYLLGVAAIGFGVAVGSTHALAGPARVSQVDAKTSLVQTVGYKKRRTYVRAPFTSVDTGRDTWVAAPFARVYSGRRGTWVRAPFVNLWVPR
jgi:hypothetical protein